MNLRPARVYADTTVFGGIVDEEFDAESRAFFDSVRQRRFQLVISAMVEEEIAGAPAEVKSLFDEMLAYAEVANISEETRQLQQAYLDAGVLTLRSATDALHVAIACTSGCALIVSWNFKHIVQYRKIQKYNAVNALNGYPAVAIHSPREVIEDEDESV